MADETKKKIILIEDDHFLVRALSLKFAKLNFELIVIENGMEALDSIRKEMPQIVFLDIMLPHKSGFEILEEMKKDEKLKNIPVLILTNLRQDEEVKHGLSLGASEYLVKTDVGLDEIVERVNKYLK